MNSSLKHDFLKWFSYFTRIATSKVEVQVDNEVMTFEPPEVITISPLLYRSDNCSTNCDKCCYFNFNLWAGCEPIPNTAQLEHIVVNSHLAKPIFIEPHSKKLCPHLTKQGCGIHDINPIHCRMPLMKFKQVKDKVYITKEQFGRNWALGCPVKFGPHDLKAYGEDMNRLCRVKKVVEYFDIETAISTIIAMVDNKQSGMVWSKQHSNQLRLVWPAKV
jgi:Fe-S-cluster containining protein